MRRNIGRLTIAALLLTSAGCSEVMAQDECAWEKRASLPPSVQRYLSQIFQKPGDVYRPYRFDLNMYVNGAPGWVSRRIEGLDQIDPVRPFSLEIYHSNFSRALLQAMAFTESRSPFYGYWRDNRAESNYVVDAYEGARYPIIGTSSFIGFDARHYRNPRAQAEAIIAQNPRRFSKGRYEIQQAGQACLMVSQNEGDRLAALLVIYDSAAPPSDDQQRRNFLQCRDKYYAWILGLRFWPAAKAYAPDVTQIPGPNYDISKYPPRLAPTSPTARVSTKSYVLRGYDRLGRVGARTDLQLPSNQSSGSIPRAAQAGASRDNPKPELVHDRHVQKIIASDGASDFTGVCRTAMKYYAKSVPWYVWADERLYE